LAKHFKKRNVTLCNGFKEPIFFEKILVFGMPNKRKMGVEENS
jgi:hypothetical protein